MHSEDLAVAFVEWPDIEFNFFNDSMCARQLGLEDLFGAAQEMLAVY
jgi:hypothetical protein